MSFYVTLPSGKSDSLFPENTRSKYSTKLFSPIQLDGSYEVGLAEIILPFSWRYKFKLSVIVGSKHKRITDQVTVNAAAPITFVQVINSLNKELEVRKYGITFTIENNFVKLVVPEDNFIEFQGDSNYYLGFLHFRIEESKIKNTFTSFYPVNQRNLINAVNVFSDIVDFQYIGDSQAPILRTVAIDNNLNFGDLIHRIYITPHYVRVSRTFIDSINIELKTDSGEDLNFLYGKVFVKLHFRKRQEWM